MYKTYPHILLSFGILNSFKSTFIHSFKFNYIILTMNNKILSSMSSMTFR
ncbi:hypothetical protein ACIN8IBEIGE_100221 [Acinetobacter sp. 8I-beige]|nr:hypothetical protein ACIN8IBEIGE_100221 [Acinetobacter sp. 8I-beige]